MKLYVLRSRLKEGIEVKREDTMREILTKVQEHLGNQPKTMVLYLVTEELSQEILDPEPRDPENISEAPSEPDSELGHQPEGEAFSSINSMGLGTPLSTQTVVQTPGQPMELTITKEDETWAELQLSQPMRHSKQTLCLEPGFKGMPQLSPPDWPTTPFDKDSPASLTQESRDRSPLGPNRMEADNEGRQDRCFRCRLTGHRVQQCPRQRGPRRRPRRRVDRQRGRRDPAS